MSAPRFRVFVNNGHDGSWDIQSLDELPDLIALALPTEEPSDGQKLFDKAETRLSLVILKLKETDT